MTLSADEFIRQFLLHVLPNGFQRIRYYGLLGNRYREEKLARCRQLLDMPACPSPASEPTKDYLDRYEELTGSSLRECPVCHQGAYGENRGLAAQPQVPNGGHGHVMTTAVEPMIKSRRTGLARPRHRGSVAARVTPAIFSRTVTTVRHPGCRFAAPWLPSATTTPVSAA